MDVSSTWPLACDLRILALDPRAVLPAYQSDMAAGLDIAAFLPDQPDGVTLEPVSRGGRPVMIRTGWAMAIPAGFEAQVRPRSGLGAKHGVTLPNAPGTIDADYRGEVKVPLINLGPEPFVVRHGDRIAQMVISPVVRARVLVVGELDVTVRGGAGFGSTGVGVTSA